LSVGVFELAAAGFLAGSTLGTGCHGGLGAVLCPGGMLLFDAAGWEAPDRGLVVEGSMVRVAFDIRGGTSGGVARP